MSKKRQRTRFVYKTKVVPYDDMLLLIKQVERHMLKEHKDAMEMFKRQTVEKGVSAFLFLFSLHLCTLVQYGEFHGKNNSCRPIFVSHAFLAQVSAWILEYEEYVCDVDMPWTREEMYEVCLREGEENDRK